MRLLIVADMQKGFVDDVLSTSETQAIVPAVCEKIQNFNGAIVVTQDTHPPDYLDTREGRILPSPTVSKTSLLGSWIIRCMTQSKTGAMLPSTP